MGDIRVELRRGPTTITVACRPSPRLALMNSGRTTGSRRRGVEDLDHASQCRLGAGSHVERLDGQPDRVDANHRSSSRIQTAQSAAALVGQVMLIAVAPRRTSIRMSRCAGNVAAVALANKAVRAVWACWLMAWNSRRAGRRPALPRRKKVGSLHFM